MPSGIIVFGANGSGKTTLGRELAYALQFKHMDIEDYHFIHSEIPYTAERTRGDCLKLMLADIQKHGSFVISAVTGDLGEEIPRMYRLAVWLSAPLETRLARIDRRSYQQHGERIRAGGNMHERHLQFADFVASRPLSKITQWAQTLTCPVMRMDGTKPISENTERIVRQYAELSAAKS